MIATDAPAARMLYSAAGVAEQLSIGLTTAKLLIRTGELRSIKVGRARRVPAEALRAYIERLENEQAAAETEAAP